MPYCLSIYTPLVLACECDPHGETDLVAVSRLSTDWQAVVNILPIYFSYRKNCLYFVTATQHLPPPSPTSFVRNPSLVVGLVLSLAHQLPVIIGLYLAFCIWFSDRPVFHHGWTSLQRHCKETLEEARKTAKLINLITIYYWLKTNTIQIIT